MATDARAAAILFAAAFLLAGPLNAQQSQRLELLSDSRVWVDGTSNREDWTVEAREVRGYVVPGSGQGALHVREAGFTVPAAKMVSRHGVIMDRLMHGALKASAHPEIRYELARAEAVPAAPGTHTVATAGSVTIAGVTRDVEQPVVAERLADGRIRFTGSTPILLSDFGMTPPTAMFGALRTGNRVVVHFELFVRP
jgi:hypothetical protein